MPVASAEASDHGPPATVFDAADALASQSDGSTIVASTVPDRAVAHVAGAEPVRMVSVGVVLIVVSIASSDALRTAVEN